MLLEVWSWRSVFALNVVLAAVAIVGTLRVRARVGGSGRLRSSTSVGAAARRGRAWSYWSTRSSRRRRTAGPPPAPSPGSPSASRSWSGFVLFELRRRHPMLDPRIFSRRRLSAGSMSIFVQFFAFFGFMFVVLQYLQLVRGDSALRLGRLDAADGRGDDADRATRRRGSSAAFGAKPVCAAGLCAGRRCAHRARPGRRVQLLLAAGRRAAAARRRHGRGDDPRHQRDHRGAARARSRESARR